MVVRHHMGEDDKGETGPISRSQAGKYVDREAQNEIGHCQRSLFLRVAMLGREDTTFTRQTETTMQGSTATMTLFGPVSVTSFLVPRTAVVGLWYFSSDFLQDRRFQAAQR